MKYRSLFFFVFFLLFCDFSAASNILDLDLGKVRDPSQGWQGIKVYKFFHKSHGLISYVESQEDDIYFAVYSKAEIMKWNTKDGAKELLSLWPLSRWRYQYATPELKERYKDFYRGEYPRSEYTIKKLWAPGCFQNRPLRYGDIDTDGVKELVLFLGNDFVVFSPEKQKIVFAENLRLDDWLPKERTVQELESKFYPDPSPYQYLSGILSDTPDVEAGYRGYSKLYFGDFDDDDNPDILVWRKLYISRASDDSVEGFKKIRDEWQHFKRNSDGEYVPQDTQQAQVLSWLQSSNLTWQKGFPSKSECVGEEGELIPEMHDPLLNDSDVLQ